MSHEQPGRPNWEIFEKILPTERCFTPFFHLPGVFRLDFSECAADIFRKCGLPAGSPRKIR